MTSLIRFVLVPALANRRHHDGRAALLALLVYRWFNRRLIRLAGRYSPFLKTFVDARSGSGSVIIVVLVMGVALAGANFPGPVIRAIGQTLLVGFVLTLAGPPRSRSTSAWSFICAVTASTSPTNLLARKHVTQMRILQRVAKTLLVILTVAIALTTSTRYVSTGSASSPRRGLPALFWVWRPGRCSATCCRIQIAMTQPVRVQGSSNRGRRVRDDRDDHQYLCRRPAVDLRRMILR